MIGITIIDGDTSCQTMMSWVSAELCKRMCSYRCWLTALLYGSLLGVVGLATTAFAIAILMAVYLLAVAQIANPGQQVWQCKSHEAWVSVLPLGSSSRCPR